MTDLKLIALDSEDLSVVSAHLQDAVMKVSDLEYDKTTKQFLIAANRFVWEDSKLGFSFFKKKRKYKRHRCNMTIKTVQSVQTRGFDQKNGDEVLSLLAIQFHPTNQTDNEGPEGQIELVLSGGAGIILGVECIEVQMADTGAAWDTQSKPRH